MEVKKAENFRKNFHKLGKGLPLAGKQKIRKNFHKLGFHKLGDQCISYEISIPFDESFGLIAIRVDSWSLSSLRPSCLNQTGDFVGLIVTVD